MDLNKVQIIWNLTQDIELKQTPNGQNVCSVSIATNRNWTDSSGMKQSQAEYHNVVLWWKLSEIANQYAQKGKKLYIEGRLQTRSWEAQDGTKRYRTEIVWENLILLWGSPSEQAEQMWTPPSNPNPTPTSSSKAPKAEEEISIEDIPF
jgi:single-strand DNA-binding protein